jgi:peptide/nickel transport system substrate-binding protein
MTVFGRLRLHAAFFLLFAVGGMLPAFRAPSSAAAATGDAPVARLTIADDRGDHGLPTPFTHAPNGVGYALTTLVFDTLVWRDQEGKTIPALARSWGKNRDGDVFEFALRTDASWHDGRPVTAADVAFTFDYFKRHPHPFFDVAAVRDVEDLGNGRIRIRLNRRYMLFVDQLAGSVPILPKHIYEHLDDPRRIKTSEVVGSGPYRLAAYDKAGRRYLFTANETYYTGPPRVRSLVFLGMEPSLAVAALKRGDIDMIRSVPVSLVPEAAAFAAVATVQSGHPVRLRFNYARPPFDDKRVRQVVAKAVDREELLRIVANGRGEISAGRFLRGSPWQQGEPLAAYAFDPQAARRELLALGFSVDDAGHFKDRDGKVFTAELAAAPRLERAASVIAAQLERFGIAMTVRVVEGGILATRLGRGDFDLALVTQSVNGDPDLMVSQMVGNGPYCDAFRQRADLIALLERQSTCADPGARRALIEQAQAIYAEELPAFFLYSPEWSTATNGKVRPWFTPGGIPPGIPVPLNKLLFTN